MKGVDWVNLIEEDNYPDDSGDYLVYMTGDGVHYFQDVAFYTEESGFTDLYHITHWRNLTENPVIN